MPSFKLTIQGVEIACNSAQDAADLLRSLGLSPVKKSKLTGNSHNTAALPAGEPVGPILEQAIAVLRSLAEHQRDGVATHEVARLFGLPDATKMGGKMNKMRALVENSLHLDRDKVYTVSRGRWFPGSDTNAALSMLEILE